MKNVYELKNVKRISESLDQLTDVRCKIAE